MEDMIKCEWCKEELPNTKSYMFFDHKTGQWHSGHKNCMNELQVELDFPRLRA